MKQGVTNYNYWEKWAKKAGLGKTKALILLGRPPNRTRIIEIQQRRFFQILKSWQPWSPGRSESSRSDIFKAVKWSQGLRIQGEKEPQQTTLTNFHSKDKLSEDRLTHKCWCNQKKLGINSWPVFRARAKLGMTSQEGGENSLANFAWEFFYLILLCLSSFSCKNDECMYLPSKPWHMHQGGLMPLVIWFFKVIDMLYTWKDTLPHRQIFPER